MRARTSLLARIAVAVAVLTALVVSPVVPGGAQPAGTRGTEDSGAAVRSRNVTLITGDVARVDTFADGRTSISVEPAAGTKESFMTYTVEGDAFVVPSDVVPYLEADRIDADLFNVSALIEQGLDDARSKRLPVIAAYRGGSKVSGRVAQPAPQGSAKTATLESANAVALTTQKSQAARFWEAIDSDGTRAALGNGINKLWLDGKVEVALADSVPQIKAPAAWAAGLDGTGTTVAVLDTGVDAEHPDLQGKVVDAAVFTGEPTPADGHGHGTHVAATVAGSGEGSSAARVGVAPGADLLNGKVLNNGGSGLESWIIDGMEWAATDKDADVVSMSLTGSPTDGTDPMSQAVDSLTASTGALFTIAAGNFGGDETVGTPGAASSALTVGAVDKSDVLAGFSSRGPRVGDFAIKPEITAPGVDIIAARGQGTSIGTPIDDLYTMLSGTSMATPHVAGAAAILAQEHPEWVAADLKAALVGTAEPNATNTVYEQGAGRVDVERAFSQDVYADAASLNLGFFDWPHEPPDAPVTETVTYSNLTDADVVLNVAVGASNDDGVPAPPAALSVAPSSVTIEPGETGSVDVTLDPAATPIGLYGGYLTATAGEVEVRTPVGFYKEPEMYNVTVEGIARDGRPAGGISSAQLWGLDTGDYLSSGYVDGTATFRVPPGTYSLMNYIFTYDEPHVYATEAAVVGNPEFVVTGDSTVSFDARDANEITHETQEPSEQRGYTLAYYRAMRELSFQSSFLLSDPINRAFAAETQPVTDGEFEFYSKWDLRAPQLVTKLVKPHSQDFDADYMFGSRLIDGRQKLPLVYVGYGHPDDYRGRDVQGKIALIERGDNLTFAQKVQNAADAGAGVALIFNNQPGLLLGSLTDPPIPTLAVSQGKGRFLLDLLRNGKVVLRLDGIPVSPYLYELLFPHADAIPTDLSYEVTADDVATIENQYHSHVPDHPAGEVRHSFRPYSFFSFAFLRDLEIPYDRTEWVSANDTRWQQQFYASFPFDGFFSERIITYDATDDITQSWLEQVADPTIVPSTEDHTESPAQRVGDTFELFIPEFSDATPGHWGFTGVAGDTSSFRVFRNAELIHETARAAGDFGVSPEESDYRLELEVRRTAPWWRLSTRTTTAWSFESARPTGTDTEILPLMLIDHELGVDELNRAPAGVSHDIDLNVQHQQGAEGPSVEDLRVWISFNDGAKWKAVDVNDEGGGNFEVTLRHPDAGDGSGFVSLRASARDSEGNRLDQTVIRAYALESPGGGRTAR